MRYAVISDIHGNFRALEAVLADAKTHGAEKTIFLGDLVFLGLDPQPCFDLLQKTHPVFCIKGNTDANLEEEATLDTTDPQQKLIEEIILYCHYRMTDVARATIASWPIRRDFEDSGYLFTLCHGSPYSFREALSPSYPIAEETRQRLSDEPATILLCGHTHIQEAFAIGDKTILNPGAVGYSLDGDPRAAYLLFDVTKTSVSWTFRRVEYDIASYRKEVTLASTHFPLFSKLSYALEYARPLSEA